MRVPFITNGYIYFFLIFLLFESCEREEIDTIIKSEDSSFSQDLKDWGSFKTGTWWVYEEQLSGLRDSVWVIKNVASTEQKPTLGFRWSPVRHPYLPYVASYCASTISDPFCYRLSETYHKNAVYLRPSHLPYYVLEPTIFIIMPSTYFNIERELTFDTTYNTEYVYKGGTPVFNTANDTVFSTLSIGQFVFENVVTKRDKNNMVFNNESTVIYSAKNIGMIRKEILEKDSNNVRKEFLKKKQIWNLIKYHIEQ